MVVLSVDFFRMAAANHIVATAVANTVNAEKGQGRIPHTSTDQQKK